MEFIYSSHSPLHINQTAPSKVVLTLTLRPSIPEVADRISTGISNTLAEGFRDSPQFLCTNFRIIGAY
jgi:hypothetical protein